MGPFNNIYNLLRKTIIFINIYKKKMSFWIWIIMFFWIYKKTYLLQFLIIIIVGKILIILLKKKMIVRYKILDLVIWTYFINFSKINRNNIITIWAIITLNFLLTFSLGLLNLWVEIYDIGYNQWKINRMGLKKINTYPYYIKECFAIFKEKYLIIIDTSVIQIWKIKIKYNIRI